MKRFSFLIVLMIVGLQGSLSAKNKEKDYFNLLVKYRTDIPEQVIKKVKKDMGYYDNQYPRIHDSWIENPFGKSVDLQGDILFPEYEYKHCKPVSPTHFELSDMYEENKGVVRTDNALIVPLENCALEYYPLYNLIVAYKDWHPHYYHSKKNGTIKIYDYYGNLLHTVDGVFKIDAFDLMNYDSVSANINLQTESGNKKLSFIRKRSSLDQDCLTNFFFEGPQATNYNIIRGLCASNNKGDQRKAMDLIDYYLDYVLPIDGFAWESSTACWDATLRYLACLNYTKDYSRLLATSDNCHSFRMRIRYAEGYPPQISRVNKEVPKIVKLSSQVEPLFLLAVNECEQKRIRDEERRQTWLAVLGVLANSLSATGGYTPAPASSATSTTIPTTGPVFNSSQSLADQCYIAPEITAMAISAGWTPDYSSSDSSMSNSSTETSTSSSSSSVKRICHACFGKGKHVACNGSGAQAAWGNKRLEKCDGCHGTGKCPHCNNGYHDN